VTWDDGDQASILENNKEGAIQPEVGMASRALM